MKLFKKVLLYSSIFAFIALISGLVLLRNIRGDEPWKKNMVGLAKVAKNFVYREATIHNPDGDMLPDQIDNNIISEVKKISN